MKKILLICCVMLVLCLGAAGLWLRQEDAAAQETTAQAAIPRRIVIDAGHGEPDGGAQGKLGTREAQINLQIAEKLRTLLEEDGYEVIMTRATEEQLLGSKNADMAERRRVIQESNQVLTVSIHQNFYEGDSSVSGPQVFYAPGSAEGERLAAVIQQELNRQLAPEKPRTEHEGNYYIVKSGEAPSVIVECGFLSNEQEEVLLTRSQYQVKLAKAIFAGVEQYLTTSAAAE